MEKRSTSERPSGHVYDLSGIFSLTLRPALDGFLFLHNNIEKKISDIPAGIYKLELMDISEIT